MKTHRIITSVAVLIVTATTLLAESQFDRELTQLQAQRDKAVATATEAINKRQQPALESLLRRATQANDLTAAIKVRDELQKIGAAGQMPNDVSGVSIESVTKRLVGTKWIWFDRETITFLADGKAQWKDNQTYWPWKVTSAGRRIIEGENANRATKFTITFDRDLKTGTITGDGGSRQTRNITTE